MGIDFSAFDAYCKNFVSMNREFDSFLKEFLLEMVLRMVERAIGHTPVDTGALRSMWFIGAIRITDEDGNVKKIALSDLMNEIEGDGKTIQIDIGNGMDYATFVEYGFQHIGGFWMGGHFMLTLSIDEIEAEMPQAFDIMFYEFLKKHGLAD